MKISESHRTNKRAKTVERKTKGRKEESVPTQQDIYTLLLSHFYALLTVLRT